MKKKENWALGLSIVAIAISIATACFCIFRIQPFTYDSMTLTVSVLVTVVTIYMFIHIIDELFLEIILKVKTIKNNYPATKISKDEIKEYIKIIASTGHRDSGELIEILNSMKE